MKVVVVPPTIAFRIENVGMAPLVELYIGCSFFSSPSRHVFEHIQGIEGPHMVACNVIPALRKEN